MNLPLNLRGKTILIAGCGGGYDVVCALPVALELAAQGNRVHLASASFTDLGKLRGTRKRGTGVTVVGPESSGDGYCPEVHLAHWLVSRPDALTGISPELFCWSRIGVLELRDVFVQLQLEIGLDALVKNDPVTQEFERALTSMYANTEAIHRSNMVGSIRASYRGEFGDVAVTTRTMLHPVWVSPLTSLFWFLDLGQTARLKLYFEALSRTRNYEQAIVVTDSLTLEGPARRPQDKPVIPI